VSKRIGTCVTTLLITFPIIGFQWHRERGEQYHFIRITIGTLSSKKSVIIAEHVPWGVDDCSGDMVEAPVVAIDERLALPWAVSRKRARDLFLEGTGW
jgi:hypothetical protein